MEKSSNNVVLPGSLVWLLCTLTLIIFIFVSFARGLYSALLVIELITICFILILVLKEYGRK